ncbi:zinc ribbon domain-containing protein [Nissabacter sp. SGAir0207]|uniref:zinc ribbon domain-containing protein n=1 Tax=Nissabacter sp. SGAir0207 TaxID=2126321 RepID=UPI0010CD6C33|nr:zinc ribbon domain-containing protein [Nissabacter sp. SGAir0207]QCR35301.1 primosomal protein N' (replication factor Y) - superfamily II helicase [Nissabacter sp. SGAir0207]
MMATCPVCAQAMSEQNGHYLCPKGHGEFRQEAACPECGLPLEVLKACGAVDYFCPNGHGLISKMRVKFCYIKEKG